MSAYTIAELKTRNLTAPWPPMRPSSAARACVKPWR